jgi:phage gp36-like protein
MSSNDAINRVALALRAACCAHPDQRVMQVLVNACCGVDPFYLEDSEAEQALRAYAEKAE